MALHPSSSASQPASSPAATTNSSLAVLPAAPALPGALEGEVISLPTDTRRPARIGLWVLGLGFGGFLLWAALAPLDEGVPAQALVTIDTKSKAVQHLTGGIVKTVHVKEGSQVKAGDALVELDDAATRASFESVRQHYLTLRAMEGRLLAEQNELTQIDFHSDLSGSASDPYVQQTMDNQNQLLRTRQAALQADLTSLQESIQGQQASIQGARGMLSARQEQLSYLKEELAGVRDLVSEGYAPRSQQLQLERQLAETQGAIIDLNAGILRSQSAINELQARRQQRIMEYRKEIDTQLAEVRREVQADADRYKAAGDDLGRMVIRAPVEGQVIGLNVQSIGAVVAPGQKLMDIAPHDEALLLEARVPPNLIDKVHAGLETDVRFVSFANTPTLVVEGLVDSISGDLLTDPHTGMPYFLARVSITPKGMQELGQRQMQAGMPAEVIIKTGERSMLTYLLHPLVKRLATSMKEE